MAVEWGLLGNGFNAMQVLQAAGQARQQRMAEERQMMQRQQAQRAAELRGRIIGGDESARREYAAMDEGYFNTLNAQTGAKAKADIEQLGQFALLADTPEKWDAYARQYVQMGHPEAAQYIGRYSPEARAAIIAQAGQAKALLEQQEAKWQSVPEGGTLVNTRDPGAVAAFQGRQGAGITQEQYQALPPGSPYTAPDGSRRVKGGAAPQGAATFP
jgi:hypothetical protein